jgi:hypothetical protein
VAEPVSWFVIERGWRVVGQDGSELGTVEETLGDSSLDIFDGLAVASGVLSKRYVPSELVAEIVEGSVKLSVDKDGFERLGAHEEPPPSATIRPD